ncbi:hypothetical protein [Roseospira navarrensis]|uniref:Uncharacterized protein n=1 Tax=Roseospira navarrensis TaxID=140058 RepID=A0A7X1ZDW7_9PROT|nr:hypothetical protein [Roseospira navarrensis]MQX36537.1 hypothetical protein [Roseospira navarrensis]
MADPVAFAWLDPALAGLLGAAVGTTELMARYRAAPLLALWTASAALYMAVNALASVAAWYALTTWFPDVTAGAGLEGRAGDILLAGLSAMAFLRTALVSVRVNDTDVPVGPSFILQTITGFADRATDRRLAAQRAEDIDRIMAGIDFARARTGLVPYCFTLMQNVGPAEQHEIATQLASLEKDETAEAIKVRTLGLLLMNIVGRKALRTAVDNLRGALGRDDSGTDESLGDPDDASPAARAAFVRRAMGGMPFATASGPFVIYCLAMAQDVDEETQRQVSRTIASLGARDMADWVKVQVLGLALVQAVGAEVLGAAAVSLRRGSPPPGGGPSGGGPSGGGAGSAEGQADSLTM